MKWLRVRNWRKHQSYRSDRGTPPWIKVHRALMSNARWASLSDAEKGHLISIWLIAAEREGRIPADAGLLRKICLIDNVPNLTKFVDLGFLETNDSHDDVTVTSERRQVGVREEEEETETEEETEKKVARTKRIVPVVGKMFFDICADAGCLDEALDWLDVLKRKKASMSETAWSRRVTKLQRLAEHEPAATILARSADSGWADLYERKQKRNVHDERETAVQRRQREAREALGV